jgi:hypothetical protein
MHSVLEQNGLAGSGAKNGGLERGDRIDDALFGGGHAGGEQRAADETGEAEGAAGK